MANIRGIGDLSANRGEYSALRGNQGALGGQYPSGGLMDNLAYEGPLGAYVPIFRRRSALPDLIDLFAPWSNNISHFQSNASCFLNFMSVAFLVIFVTGSIQGASCFS